MRESDINLQLRILRDTLSTKNTFVQGENWFGVHEVYDHLAAKVGEFDFGAARAFAEDEGGNFFLLEATTEAVVFLDHETDDRTTLAKSLKEFVAQLKEAPTVTLNPGQVKKAWIDPDFLKSLKKKP